MVDRLPNLIIQIKSFFTSTEHTDYHALQHGTESRVNVSCKRKEVCMTANQINYARHLEDKRHNEATESETKRNNLVVSTETNRHNLATEAEQARTNTINDNHYQRMDAETKRHNQVYEQETNRHNLATESIGAYEASTNRFNAISNREIGLANANANAMQAEAARKNAATNSRKAGSEILKNTAQADLYGNQSGLADAQRRTTLYNMASDIVNMPINQGSKWAQAVGGLIRGAAGVLQTGVRLITW